MNVCNTYCPAYPGHLHPQVYSMKRTHFAHSWLETNVKHWYPTCQMHYTSLRTLLQTISAPVNHTFLRAKYQQNWRYLPALHCNILPSLTQYSSSALRHSHSTTKFHSFTNTSLQMALLLLSLEGKYPESISYKAKGIGWTSPPNHMLGVHVSVHQV